MSEGSKRQERRDAKRIKRQLQETNPSYSDEPFAPVEPQNAEPKPLSAEEIATKRTRIIRQGFALLAQNSTVRTVDLSTPQDRIYSLYRPTVYTPRSPRSPQRVQTGQDATVDEIRNVINRGKA